MKSLIHVIFLIAMAAGSAWAGDEAPTALSNKEAISLVQDHANYLWTLIAAALVFFMQAGFAMVEAGFTRAKNAVNILMKNLMDFSMGSIVYWAIGFGLMFGASGTGWFGTSGFFLSDFTPDGDPWVLAFWMFQVVFAATAATIVSGAMAERTKFTGYLIYSAIISGLLALPLALPLSLALPLTLTLTLAFALTLSLSLAFALTPGTFHHFECLRGLGHGNCTETSQPHLVGRFHDVVLNLFALLFLGHLPCRSRFRPQCRSGGP